MFRTSNGKFLHDKMAKHLMDNYKFVTIAGTLYVWYNGCYRVNVWDIVDYLCVQLDCGTIESNRKEVYKTIKSHKVNFDKFVEVDPYKIAFNNGILDVKTMKFYYEDEDLTRFAVCNKINHMYDYNAEYNEVVDKQMLAWADGDTNVQELLYQLMGYPMLVNCNLRTMFLIHGSAQGGKTKFVEYIQNIYGNENYSTFDISEINNRFNRALSCGKLFNYSDDIDAGYIDKPNFLKRLISGITTMQVERKCLDGYTAPFYAKLIMSMNEFPKIKMDSDVTAWESRFNIIHFKHKFDVNPNYDEWARENLMNEQAITFAIKKAADAIHKAIVDGGFVVASKEQFDEFLKNNNPFLDYALSKSLGEWKEIYDVKQWFTNTVSEYGYKTSFASFRNTFNKLSELKIYESSTTNNGKKVRVWRVKKP